MDITNAVEVVRQLLEKEGHFTDLVNFSIYWRSPKKANWVGMYRKYSIYKGKATISININAEWESLSDVVDTILHELGHALWDTIQPEWQQKWFDAHSQEKWGAEEAFADNLMHFLNENTEDIIDRKLFLLMIFEESDPIHQT